jgi:hypothetical protein
VESNHCYELRRLLYFPLYERQININMKRLDIIPIAFAGGTGGRFLSTFLYNAKEHIDSMTLTTYGSAIFCDHDRYPHPGPQENVTAHLVAINKLPVTPKTKYIPCHIYNIHLLIAFYDKVITIVHDDNDIPAILTIFRHKWGHDEQQLADYLYVSGMYDQSRIHSLDSPQVLNICWKDLMWQSPELFIENLSKFTHIPVTDFYKEQLCFWRSKTLSVL